MSLPPQGLDAVRRAAEQAPPLTPAQRTQLAALLAPAIDRLRRRQGAA